MDDRAGADGTPLSRHGGEVLVWMVAVRGWIGKAASEDGPHLTPCSCFLSPPFSLVSA